jgi:ATP-dependent helicase HrpA
MQHNETIRREVEELEHKRRKKDVLADEYNQFNFFDARIPDDINSAVGFEKWLGSLARADRDLLYLGHDVLMREDAGLAPRELYPDKLEAVGKLFPLAYHFEPGHEEDGVTVTVPLELLNTLDPGRLQWLVPGLLREKLIALIRQLPKPQRRSLTPVPVFAEALVESIQGNSQRSLLEECADGLNKMTGMEILPQDLDEEAIADHLRFRICVSGKDGKIIAQGRDLQSLQEELGNKAQRRFMDRHGASFNRDAVTSWEFGELETCVTTADGTRAWPALVDQEAAVGLRLFDTVQEAALSHVEGIRRLLALNLTDKLNYLAKHHGLTREALLTWSSLGSTTDLVQDLVWKNLCDTAGNVSGIRDKAAFEALRGQVRSAMGHSFLQLAGQLNDLLPLCGHVFGRLSGEIESRWPDVCAEVDSQMQDLVYPGFLADLEPGRLSHYPRYLMGIMERLDQLEQNPQRDHQRMALVAPWWQAYLGALEEGVPYDEAMDNFRWLLEEYRISLFAQGLGTDGKVSEKRLEAAWKKTGPG